MEEHGIVIYKLGSLNMKFFGYEDCSQVRQSHMHQLILLGCMYGVQVPVVWTLPFRSDTLSVVGISYAMHSCGFSATVPSNLFTVLSQ